VQNLNDKMKTKLVSAVCVALMLTSATPCLADQIDDSVAAIADVTIVRPGCFIATVIGSALFVVALPFAAMSKSVKSTANTLVVKPAKATFTRPVGDMDALSAY
jgi:hypothetical protein